MQVGRCAVGQVCRWVGVQVGRCAVGQVCRLAGVQVGRCADGQVCRWEGMQRRKRCVGSTGPISTTVRCYFRSAAVKVMALVALPATGASGFPASSSDGFVPRCWMSGFVYFCALSTVQRAAALAGSSCTVFRFRIFKPAKHSTLMYVQYT